MKTDPLKLMAYATLIACASCCASKKPVPEHRSAALYQEGVPGGVTVDTLQITATVTAVDHAKREATLVTPKGETIHYKAKPEVRNFDQVQVGDQVRATVLEHVVVYVRDKGDTTSRGPSGLVALAPKGEKPGVVMADTSEITTRVKSVDLKHHKATLEFPDGSTQTVTVRPDVKLSETDVGREVVIQATEAVAVLVEKP